MSTYDSIKTFQKCPYCNDYQSFEAQTKDLGDMIYTYHPYEKDKLLDRTKLPVFGCGPFDITYKLWKSQDERNRENARVPDEYKDLKFIEVVCDCHSIKCQFDADRDDIIRQGCPSGFGRMFHGKIAIKDSMLTGNIYDIMKDNLTENKLNRWKKLHPKEYRKLMKKYKHEPIAIREWNREIPSFHRLTIDTKKKKIKSELIKFPIMIK